MPGIICIRELGGNRLPKVQLGSIAEVRLRLEIGEAETAESGWLRVVLGRLHDGTDRRADPLSRRHGGAVGESEWPEGGPASTHYDSVSM